MVAVSPPVVRQSTALGVFSGTASTHAVAAFTSPTLTASRLVCWVGLNNNQTDGIGVTVSGYTAVGTVVRQASGHDAVTTYAFEKLNAAGTASPATVTYTGIGTAGLASWAHLEEVTGDDPATSSSVLATGVGSSTNPVIGPTTATTQPDTLLLGAVTSPNIQVTSLHTGSPFSQVTAGSSSGTADPSKVTALVAQDALPAQSSTATLSVDVAGVNARQYAGMIIGVPSPAPGGGGAGPQQFPLGPPDTNGYTTLDDPGLATPSKRAVLWQPVLQNNVDYVLNAPVQRTAGLAIIGGRNVVVPHLDIKMATGANVMVAIGGGAAGAIVHIQNFHLDPNGNQCDAIKTTSACSRILQLKVGRVEKLIGLTSNVHADLFQCSAGIGDLWVEDFTGYTTYDGWMMQREANIEQQTQYWAVTAGSVIGGTAYEMTAPNHNFVVGDPVAQWSLSPSSYNGGYTVLSVSGSGSSKKYVVKKGDPSPGTVSSGGFATKMSFAYNVGSINFNRVNVKGFASTFGTAAVPPEALQSIRFGARVAPSANPGNPGTVLPGYPGHPNEDQTPLNVDQWAGSLTATNWYAMPPPSTSTVGQFVEPDSGTVNYSVIRPTDHVAAGTVPAYCDWANHPHVSGRLNFGTPPFGDYVIIQGGNPVATAGGTPTPPAAPVNTTPPAVVPTNPLDTDTLFVNTGVWSGVDDTSLWTVNWYHRLGTSGSWGSAITTFGPTDQHSVVVSGTQLLTPAEDGYQWRVGVIADNGTPGSEAFSDPTALVVGPVSIVLDVEVE